MDERRSAYYDRVRSRRGPSPYRGPLRPRTAPAKDHAGSPALTRLPRSRLPTPSWNSARHGRGASACQAVLAPWLVLILALGCGAAGCQREETGAQGAAAREPGESRGDDDVSLLTAGATPHAELRWDLTALEDRDQEAVFALVSRSLVDESERPSQPAPPMRVVTRLRPMATEGATRAVRFEVADIDVVLAGDAPSTLEELTRGLIELLPRSAGTYRVDSRGRILAFDVEGTGAIPAATGGVHENLRMALQQTHIVFPEEAVGVGATWVVRSRFRASDLFDVDQEITYRLVEREGQRVVVEGTIAMQAAPQEGSLGDLGGAPVSVRLASLRGEGTLQATLALDAFETTSRTLSEMEMEMRFTPRPGADEVTTRTLTATRLDVTHRAPGPLLIAPPADGQPLPTAPANSEEPAIQAPAP